MQIRTSLATLTACLLFGITGRAQKKILLWPGGAPGSEGKAAQQIVVRTAENGVDTKNAKRKK